MTKVRNIVLVGGGHTHALLCQYLGMSPLPGLRVTLINQTPGTPYSGMIPGVIAGYYQPNEAFLDLVHLCNWSQVEFICDQVVNLDPIKKVCLFGSRPPLPYDILSINIGSKPSPHIPGSARYAIGIKPMSTLLAKLSDWPSAIESSNELSKRITIIGGGASSIEAALALNYRFGSQVKVSLISQNDRLLPKTSRRNSEKVHRMLGQAGISTFMNHKVVRVAENEVITNQTTVPFDFCIYATQASASTNIKNWQLPLTDDGFIKVSTSLQVEGSTNMFAAGDCAAIRNYHLEKSGVYAVRQAPVLWHNIIATATSSSLKNYRPQKNFLTIMGLPNHPVLLTKGAISSSWHGWWTLKEYIDRKFMKRFATRMVSMAAQSLSATDHSEIPSRPNAIRCRGCGAKLGSNTMKDTLNELNQKYAHFDNNPLQYINFDEDATYVSLNSKGFFATIDQVSALIDDPYLWGKVATLHALSDLFARGSSANYIGLTLQVTHSENRRTTKHKIMAIMSGVLDTLRSHQSQLIAGHTSYGNEDSLSIMAIGGCNDSSSPALSKDGSQIGDAVILTKAIGVGAIMASKMRRMDLFCGDHYYGALQSMLLSNEPAASILADHASAATDVTGFGLGGHLLEMLKPSNLTCRLTMTSIPLLSGFIKLCQVQCISSIHPENLEFIEPNLDLRDFRPNPELINLAQAILCDPQTSGGLLATVPIQKVDEILGKLRSNGYPQASKIGEIIKQNPKEDAKIVLN